MHAPSVIAVACLSLFAACTAGDDSTPTTQGPDGTEARRSIWTFEDLPSGRGRPDSAQLSAVLPPEVGGAWAAVGSIINGNGEARARIWRSPDARSWDSTAIDERPGTEAFGAVRLGDALVVVGRRSVGSGTKPVVWLEGSAGFREVGLPSAAGESRSLLTDVVVTPSGLLAVGRTADGGDTDLTLWHSRQGTDWARLGEAEASFAPPGQRAYVSALRRVPAGVVAVGTVQEGSYNVDAAAWFSADGLSWAPAAPAVDFAGRGDQALASVTQTTGGLLAVGRTNDGHLAVPRAWASVDGRAWQTIDADFEVGGDGSDSFGTLVRAVTTTSEGLVAVGYGAGGERFWRSTDGRRWRELELPEGARYQQAFSLTMLAAHGDELLLGDGSGPYLLLRRADGQFEEVTSQPSGFPAPTPVVSAPNLAAAGTSVIASANVFQAGRRLDDESTDVVIWTTGDGRRWTSAPRGAFQNAFVGGLAGDLNGRLRAVGGRSLISAVLDREETAFLSWVSDDGLSWSREEPTVLPDDDEITASSGRGLSAVASRGGTTIAVGNFFNGIDSDGVIMRRSADEQFTHVESIPGLAGPEDESLVTTCAGSAGYVAAGSIEDGFRSTAAVWFSPDGERWRQVQTNDLAGEESSAIYGCTARGDGFVAVGLRDGDAAAWASPDGAVWRLVDPGTFAAEGDQAFLSVAAIGDVVLAIGGDSASGQNRIALWRSADGGESWSPITLDGPDFKGTLRQYAFSLLVWRNRVLIGGMVDEDVRIWSAAVADLD